MRRIPMLFGQRAAGPNGRFVGISCAGSAKLPSSAAMRFLQREAVVEGVRLRVGDLDDVHADSVSLPLGASSQRSS